MTDPQACSCGESGTRVEFVGPVRFDTTPADGAVNVTASQRFRWWCDQHWPHGSSTIMRIERSPLLTSSSR